MPNDISKCPICGWDTTVTHLPDADLVKCELCGEFKITGSLLATAFSDTEPEKVRGLLPYLSAHTRQATERGEIITLDTRNWQAFALIHQRTPISRKITKLMELIVSRSKPGHGAQIAPGADAPLVDAESKTEMNLLLGHLVETGYLRQLPGSNYLLEVKGWGQMEQAMITGIPGKCFVAMSFDEDLKPVYDEGIEAVKIDCKMDPVRIDFVPHNDNIVDKIIAEIRTCQFMVADFTGQKAGVYFEAGFAKGLGRPVIWTCRKDDFKDIHFDIAQFSHIIWKDPGDLRMRLADKIKATIELALLHALFSLDPSLSLEI